MEHCLACNREVTPVTEFTTSGLVKRCPYPDCGAPFSRVDTETTAEPVPAAPKRRTKKPNAAESFDVVKAARTRQKHLAREIKRMRKELRAAEKEEGQLSRLLAAADEKPAAKVRAIRDAG